MFVSQALQKHSSYKDFNFKPFEKKDTKHYSKNLALKYITDTEIIILLKNKWCLKTE